MVARGASSPRSHWHHRFAAEQRGTTEALMLAHGFTQRMLTGLVRAGLAMRYRMPLTAGGRTIEVTYVMIAAAGRMAIEGRPGARSSLDYEHGGLHGVSAEPVQGFLPVRERGSRPPGLDALGENSPLS